jgi:hypothetical protein
MRDEVAAAYAKRDYLFANIVEVEGPLPTKCWEWQRASQYFGYGIVVYKNRHYGAHRLFYILHKGPIPSDLECTHVCDHGPCCNPHHLRVATHRDNLRDCAAKGRLYSGGRAVLTIADVANIRGLLLNSWFGLKTELADRYGISTGAINLIASGVNWPDVAPSPNPVMPPLPFPRFERRF